MSGGQKCCLVWDTRVRTADPEHLDSETADIWNGTHTLSTSCKQFKVSCLNPLTQCWRRGDPVSLSVGLRPAQRQISPPMASTLCIFHARMRTTSTAMHRRSMRVPYSLPNANTFLAMVVTVRHHKGIRHTCYLANHWLTPDL